MNNFLIVGLVSLLLIAAVLGPDFFVKLYNEYNKPKYKVGDKLALDVELEEFESATIVVVTHVGKKSYGYRFFHSGYESSMLNKKDFKVFEAIYKPLSN